MLPLRNESFVFVRRFIGGSMHNGIGSTQTTQQNAKLNTTAITTRRAENIARVRRVVATALAVSWETIDGFVGTAQKPVQAIITARYANPGQQTNASIGRYATF